MTDKELYTYFFWAAVFVIVVIFIIIKLVKYHQKQLLRQLTSEVLESLGIDNWLFKNVDDGIRLKSSKAVDEYDIIKYFKDNRDKIEVALKRLEAKAEYEKRLRDFLAHNDYMNRPMYSKLEPVIYDNLKGLNTFNVHISYISPAGRSFNQNILRISKGHIEKIKANPALIMSKSEFNKLQKEQNQEILDRKHHSYYDMVNNIIDLANNNGSKLVIKGDRDELDKQISSLFEKTVNSIKKIKSVDSEEWDVIKKIIFDIDQKVNQIIERNQRILDYYKSDDFKKIKNTCDSLMRSQKEFNDYISEKANSISKLFGTRIVRNETVNDDKYNYIRPYKKSITPFTAEVSSAVFSSAENNPINYIVKYFYPNKSIYPEQIQKLQFLIEELETLKEARQIIENYKKDYHQYITNVPPYVMQNDEEGFYSRLGFASVSEDDLTIEYKFAYTSDGGMAQRSFSIPMTEETIVELINTLQSSLSMSAFAKEQRMMMTSKLRQHIKERDNFTCKICNNSIYNEPNLLLEIDHIIPVSKGGCTVEDNLQTLCWKCNRSKSSKMM